MSTPKTHFKASPPEHSFIVGRTVTRCGKLVVDSRIVKTTDKLTCEHCLSIHGSHARRFMGRSGR